MDNIPVRNIFAAVFEKSSLDPILQVLSIGKVKFWGTEGTAKYLKQKGYNATSVVTGFDFGGRVKSLDREIFARVLADRAKAVDLRELKKMNLEPFDLVIVDLYAPDKNKFPEMMDIGGQALIRGAIKNWQNVALAFNKMSIFDLAGDVRRNEGSTSSKFRKKQAADALKFIAERNTQEAKLLK